MNKTIYFAGGCFWGMEKLFKQIDGVVDTECGYANGDESIVPDYKTVCKGGTFYRETVRVVYDTDKVTLEQLLKAFFFVVDPTTKDRQAGDVGDQYQTGIYYLDSDDKKIIEDYVNRIKDNYSVFYTEVKPLVRFYNAEDYHQDYLDNNPTGYCHISNIKYEEVNEFIRKK